MAGIGFEVATEVLAGLLIGLAIDHFAGTGKRWTTIGAIAGIVVGLYSLIRSTLKLNRQLDQSFPTTGRGKAISDEEWDAWHEDEEDDEGRDS